MTSSKHCYALIRNIPKEYRSQDLRSFFYDAINSDEQIFSAFHFRHRPEVKIVQNQEQQASTSQNVSTCCCLVKIFDHQKRSQLIKNYNNSRWTDRFDKEHQFLKCFISPVKLTNEEISKTIELNFDGKFMPQGNVGTPDKFFKEKIRNCTLPTNVIKKLNLDNCWLKSNVKNRRYSQVPPPEQKFLREEHPTVDNDEDECQEFERHESNYDDVDEQARIKERLYEKEMDIVWEKGGPGLVFYTDASFWDEQRGTDTDERWADDWDVDFRPYYGAESEADRDARDMARMRREEAGVYESAFKKKKDEEKTKRNAEKRDPSPDFGSFEKHTKAIGRRLLLRKGWREGRGLGADERNLGQVLPVALDLEERSQTPKIKTGFGYRGEKLQRTGLKKFNDGEKRLISTIFDQKRGDVEETADGIQRRNELTYDKYRNLKNP